MVRSAVKILDLLREEWLVGGEEGRMSKKQKCGTQTWILSPFLTRSTQNNSDM